MKSLALSACLAIAATSALANVGPVFLPDFTFPAPVNAPDVSTQDCVAPAEGGKTCK